MHYWGGFQFDPTFHFLRLLSKQVELFSALFVIAWILVTHLGGKNDIGCTILMPININKHYCAISENLFWPLFLNRIFFFFKLFLKCKCILVVQLWGKFYWKLLWRSSWLLLLFFSKRKFVLCQPFSNDFFLMFFLLLYDCFRCIHMWCRIRTGITMEKLSNCWVQVFPPYAQTEVKSSLGSV